MSKVLLVEDDNNLREIYEARLSAEGYDIVTAQNGEEALVIAKQERPDLIVSDVMMPRISGFEMLDILRNTPELHDTKVIMLTALGQAEDQARAGKLGADKYLVKSQVTLEDIVNCARDLLEGTTVVEPTTPTTATAATAPDNIANPMTASAPAAAEPLPSTPEAPSVFDTPVPTPPMPMTTPALAIPASPSPVSADPVTSQPVQAVTPDPATVMQPQSISPVMDTPDSTGTPSSYPMADTSGTPTASTPAADTDVSTYSFTPPVEPTTAVVSVTDPDPLATTPSEAPIQPIVDTSDLTTQAPAESSLPPVPLPMPPLDQTAIPPLPPAYEEPSSNSVIDNTQTRTSEEAIMAAQIEAFTGQPTSVVEATTAEPVTSLGSDVNPVIAPTFPPDTTADQVANDAVLNTAIEQLTANAPVAPTPMPNPEPEVPVSTPPTDSTPKAESDSDQVPVAGKKVIQPLNDIAQGPNLNELLAKEAALEQSGQMPPPTTPAEAPQMPPETPRSSSGVDPNSIAL